MNCPEYQELLPKEKTELIGKIVHCLQSDSQLYKHCRDIIELGEKRGLFDGVTILPEPEKNNEQ